jgi:Ca-activated chloride channel family protein
MIGFAFPWLLVLLPPALYFGWRAVYRWGVPSSRPATRLARITAHHLPIVLAALLALAAAGPEWRRPLEGVAPAVDFAVVLDGSSSMRILDDGKEDRWNAARRLLQTFIGRRPHDRFALVLFSAHPVTLSPLTADHKRLERALQSLNLDVRDDGTAIGSALLTAVRRLADSPARSRAILLLTDGAQNRGRVLPVEAAQEAAQSGIRIYTVGIGHSGESLVPIEGGGRVWLHVDTDPDTLKQVAADTGGEFFEAKDPAGLARALAAVDRLETTALPVDAPTEAIPLAKWLLLLAALLALPLALDLARKRGKAQPLWMAAP